MKIENLSIGVVCGGFSNEREISLRGAQSIHQTLVAKNINSRLIDIKDKNEMHDKKMYEGIDFALVMIHGKGGEDGEVQEFLSSLNIKVKGIHEYADPQAAVASAKAIAIGGGNTFNLLHQLYENNLITCLQKQVNQGIPYIGWSAGSNVAGTSIRTTNDMPIIEPKSFAALNLVPFQLNPHYIEESPSDHHGETREQRLAEFMVLHPETNIVGLVEGSALKLSSNKRKQHLQLLGTEQGYLFRAGEKQIIDNQTDLSYLLA